MKTMTGNDPFAALVEPATLRIERRLPGPLERVWECLTRSELRADGSRPARWISAPELPSPSPGATTISPRRQVNAPRERPRS